MLCGITARTLGRDNKPKRWDTIFYNVKVHLSQPGHLR